MLSSDNKTIDSVLSNKTKEIIAELGSIDPAFTFYIQAIGDALASLYLGSFASAPVGPIDGNLYYDRTLTKLRVYDVDHWQDIGPSSYSIDPTVYCPNYPITVVNQDITIANFEVSDLFYTGRTVVFKAPLGDLTTVILSSANNAGDTELTVADILPLNITEMCLGTSSTNWLPIATDPFSGDSINAITSGSISSVVYWVAVGANGKAFYSINKGIDWTSIATGTTNTLNGVGYNKHDESFMIVGQSSTFLHSTDVLNWSLDTTSLATHVTSGSGDCTDVIWEQTNLSWAITCHLFAGNYTILHSTTADLTTWSLGTTFASPTVNCKLIVEKTVTDDKLLIAPYNAIIYSVDGVSDTSEMGVTNRIGEISTNLLNITNAVYGYFTAWEDGLVSYKVSAVLTYESSAPQPIRSLAYSGAALHNRMVCVGDNGFIGYVNGGDFETNFNITSVPNAFNPLARINDIECNDIDGVFIAVADNGQICTSTNGAL